MPWFRLFACGEDFPVIIDNNTEIVGFYTTRYIEAATQGEAEALCSELLFEDEDLKPPPGNWSDFQPRIMFEEVQQSRRTCRHRRQFLFLPDGGRSRRRGLLMAKKATIYHNPKCSTSRHALKMIEAAGYKPEVIEYLKVGWTKKQLKDLFAAADLTPRQALRARSAEAEELGLLNPKVSDAKLLDAMIEHPVLVERPFVVTAKGARLARPKDLVKEIL